MTEREINSVVWLALYFRRNGVKHSQIDWPTLRKCYDYMEENMVEGNEALPTVAKIEVEQSEISNLWHWRIVKGPEGYAGDCLIASNGYADEDECRENLAAVQQALRTWLAIADSEDDGSA